MDFGYEYTLHTHVNTMKYPPPPNFDAGAKLFEKKKSLTVCQEKFAEGASDLFEQD